MANRPKDTLGKHGTGPLAATSIACDTQSDDVIHSVLPLPASGCALPGERRRNMKNLNSILNASLKAASFGAAALAITLSFGSAFAQTGASAARIEQKHQDVEAYWTPERLLNARPVTRTGSPVASGQDKMKAAAVAEGDPVSEPGSAPKLKASPYDAKTFIPEAYLKNRQKPAVESATREVTPMATTTNYKALFTTSRVFPDEAVAAYPNIAIGKLFFTDPKKPGEWVCSASVLRQRIVVTAGHCVAHGSTDASERYFYTNFYFIPAYNQGQGPLGAFTVHQAWVSNAWYQVDEQVPNAQDLGMLIINDRDGNKIADYTGYLGYQTLSLSSNNVTMVGYPNNLDDGERMQINFAQSYENGGNNTWIYGSGMGPGSSGGPWIQDYGVAPDTTDGIAMGRNRLVGVTSYGPKDAFGYQGASILDSRFMNLLNLACSAQPGNCN